MLKSAATRLRFLAVGAALLAAIAGAAPAAAAGPRFDPPKSYYLSLGDSLAFGFQQAKLLSELNTGTYSPANFPGYTYPLRARLQAIQPTLQVVDYGCPGETTTSFAVRCAFQDVQGIPLHDSYAGRSQEVAALEFLHAHPGQVSPITVSLGANDAEQGVGNDTIRQNLTRILGELRAAAPYAEIIVLQYYNPFYVVNQSSDPIIAAVDSSIADAAASADGYVADALAVINNPNPTPPATEFGDVCFYTLMCPGGDVHLSDPGYLVVAGIFWDASGYTRLLS